MNELDDRWQIGQTVEQPISGLNRIVLPIQTTSETNPILFSRLVTWDEIVEGWLEEGYEQAANDHRDEIVGDMDWAGEFSETESWESFLANCAEAIRSWLDETCNTDCHVEDDDD